MSRGTFGLPERRPLFLMMDKARFASAGDWYGIFVHGAMRRVPCVRGACMVYPKPDT